MELTAHAKINWDLHVLGKRPDGFHEVDTVMVSVGLADRLVVEAADAFTLTCSDPGLPCDDSNLVTKAAKALAKAAGVEPRARIHLEKRVPAGGGLGGGSSDAANALLGLNELWRQGWTRERLSEIAATFGSDIGFFLWGGWARCRGRGEIVEPIPGSAAWPAARLFLLLPALSVPTPPVYKALNAPPWDPSKKRLRNLTSLADNINLLLVCLGKDEPFASWPDNGLQQAACVVEPRLEALQKALAEWFPGRWQMSGSGAVHVVLPGPNEKAEAVQDRIDAAMPYAVRVVETNTITPCFSPRP
ncbi:MAG: 4-(cytidine 5'-diphospho)-2-C-methyl-D-erythritol kinase [Planctomycetota bacterium]|nr:4-(cytidine 5'-diphospho)-2-C-methyl-D-erythritol kinase [Planctomycetota bacterium]